MQSWAVSKSRQTDQYDAALKVLNDQLAKHLYRFCFNDYMYCAAPNFNRIKLVTKNKKNIKKKLAQKSNLCLEEQVRHYIS